MTTSHGWLSMESAPKDGTLIDLLYPYPRGRTIDCYWDEEFLTGWVWRTPTWEAAQLDPKPWEQWSVNSYPNMEPMFWRPCPTLPIEALPHAAAGSTGEQSTEDASAQ